MKKMTSLFLLVSIFFSCNKSVNEIVAKIEKTVSKINGSITELKKKQVEDIVSLSGGSITGYYSDDEVRKVYAEQFTDTNRTFTNYYFDDGMLIFIDEQNFIYNKSKKYTEAVAAATHDTDWYDDKKTKLMVSRYYFRKNKLVRWVVDKTEMPPNEPEFKDKESMMWAQSAILIKELKEQ